MRDNGPGNGPTHVAVDHDTSETDPHNGALALESQDEAKLACALACVTFLAGVSDRVLMGEGLAASWFDGSWLF